MERRRQSEPGRMATWAYLPQVRTKYAGIESLSSPKKGGTKKDSPPNERLQPGGPRAHDGPLVMRER
jgi:hypothetical protein